MYLLIKWKVNIIKYQENYIFFCLANFNLPEVADGKIFYLKNIFFKTNCL